VDNGPITAVRDGSKLPKVIAVTRFGVLAWKRFSERARSSTVVLGNHPYSVDIPRAFPLQYFDIAPITMSFSGQLSIGERVRWTKEGAKAYRQSQQSLAVGGGAVAVVALPAAHRLKRLVVLLATPVVLLLSPGRASAILTYNIFESDGDVIIQTNGALNLPPSQLAEGSCGFNSYFFGGQAEICTGGFLSEVASYSISGPSTFLQGSVACTGWCNVQFPRFYPADSWSGLHTHLSGLFGHIFIDPAYVSGSPIVSRATFNARTLADLDITAAGLIGTWTLAETGDKINVFVGSPATGVPGPLPLFGAAAAFGWSRRLRRRLSTPKSSTAD
jgi:hypothetical protein